MDQRHIFILVFLFTLISTCLVAAVSLFTGQGWLVTVLYALATMWIVGILSQVIFRHLYLQVVFPTEVQRTKEELKKGYSRSDELEEVEAIDDAVRVIEQSEAEQDGMRG